MREPGGGRRADESRRDEGGELIADVRDGPDQGRGRARERLDDVGATRADLRDGHGKPVHLVLLPGLGPGTQVLPLAAAADLAERRVVGGGPAVGEGPRRQCPCWFGMSALSNPCS